MRYFVAVAEALSFRKFTNKDCLIVVSLQLPSASGVGGRRAAMRVSWVSLVLKLLRVDD